MAVPTDDRPPGAVKQNSYDSNQPAVQGSAPLSNGQPNLSLRPHDQADSSALSPITHDRSRPSVDNPTEGGSKERSKSNGRRPSGQQRTCGKCQRHLTGQFVRALGDTYHLECFTCHVRNPNILVYDERRRD